MTYNTKVYRKQGGDELVVASGGKITVEAGGVIAGQTQTWPLGGHLFQSRVLASAETLTSGYTGFLGSESTPPLALNSTADQSAYINWASAVVAAIKLPPIALPDELSTAAGISVDLLGESIGTATAADAIAAFDVRCWIGVGDTEMGSTHSNFTSTPSWKSISIASGDITSGQLNITLVPQAHAGRAIRLYDMRMRYTRSS